jgi:hypothetical protein
MREMGNAYKILDEKPAEKRLLKRPRHRCKKKLKTDLNSYKL